MKIIDYSFNKQLRHLVQWCRPKARYVLSKAAFAKLNDRRQALGAACFDDNTRRRLSLSISSDRLRVNTRTISLAVDSCPTFSEFVKTTYLLGYIGGEYFCELILDTSNLELLDEIK